MTPLAVIATVEIEQLKKDSFFVANYYRCLDQYKNALWFHYSYVLWRNYKTRNTIAY